MICSALFLNSRVFDECLEGRVLNNAVYFFTHLMYTVSVNLTVWRTQIWRDKVRCFLLKELECFTVTSEHVISVAAI